MAGDSRLCAGVMIWRPRPASTVARRASVSQAVMAMTGRSWMTTATLSVSTSTAGWAATGAGTAVRPGGTGSPLPA
ncbi:MAG TPA: hypothetical protein DEQ61_00630, partial [Streptomyces sp.]|nr:hypothetical protein [Streptomyces sp.]